MPIDKVDEAGRESFPASDAPSWTMTHAGPASSPVLAPQPSEAQGHDRLLDWDGYRKWLAEAMAGIARASPDLMKGYRTLAGARTAQAALDAKTRELIALAVAVTLRCDGCIAIHADAARRRGATREELTEALGIAVMVGAGAALVSSARTLDAFASGAPR